jgi:hypothetical protein
MWIEKTMKSSAVSVAGVQRAGQSLFASSSREPLGKGLTLNEVGSRLYELRPKPQPE